MLYYYMMLKITQTNISTLKQNEHIAIFFVKYNMPLPVNSSFSFNKKTLLGYKQDILQVLSSSIPLNKVF